LWRTTASFGEAWQQCRQTTAKEDMAGDVLQAGSATQISSNVDGHPMGQYWLGIGEDEVGLIHRPPLNVVVVQAWRGTRIAS
jgi:hypothetical protein